MQTNLGVFTADLGSLSQPIKITLSQPPHLGNSSLTSEQRRKIEENRQKALEIRKKLEQHNLDASSYKPETSLISKEVKPEATKKRWQDKVSIKKADYIEYDFSTMKDSHGGFMNNDNEEQEVNESLEQWKAKQKQDHIVRELAPPIDISQAPKCFECESLEIDANLYSNFWQTRVCRRCAKEKPEKYALLTKTECREDYLLTESELKDTDLLPRIEKPNPHGYSRMQLFLRFQVEKIAITKWGSLENLDKEWERREEMRLKRKDKKYNEQLKKMRRKTRAEEFTRRLRNGESINDKHVHDWEKIGESESNGMVCFKNRCIDCGMEKEELRV